MIFNKIKKILPEWLLIILLSVKYKIQKYFISKEENDFLIRSKLFYSKLINKNDLYFDVGANVGNRIITMLSLGAKIVAVEPQKSCQLVLESKFGNKISIVNQGLSSRVEKKTF